MTATNELVTGVDFVGIPTRDLERTIDFYGDKLGLRRSAYRPERGFAEFETGNVTLSIYNPSQMGMEHHPGRNPIALHVADIEAARSELEQAGVEFSADTLDTGVCHMAFFTDPDGNALMLHHRYAPRRAES
jgi:catechol 2,3-dioxygenase-like lactoylglutathione lyase family enzyme